MIKLTKIEKEAGPKFTVNFNYMIGDADGDHTETFYINDSEFPKELEKQLLVLKKLLSFDYVRFWELDDYRKLYKNKKITEEEYAIFLTNLACHNGYLTYDDNNDWTFSNENKKLFKKYLGTKDDIEIIENYHIKPEYESNIIGETDLGYYDLTDFDITYIDENGVEYNAEIE